ncbi:invasion associated locus B family protein [Roseibium suaedae]|uniref:Invasion protein IalB, involved in pathogenesis n=1 Tax=Roseibium suaedae TaxID=735517 RepID=A0A1M7NQA9_9HYPH|nr:invasion associated locus B family protein [Roseibium suaedae]SHN06124.1 Invasion protein IalB, involved in pathogenesis [Roseibium suaedae]
MFNKLFPLRLTASTISLATALVMASPAFAASPANKPASGAPQSTTATYGNWVLRCVQMATGAADASGAQATVNSCEIIHTVQVQGQNAPFTQIAIGRLPGQQELILTAVVPVNVTLPGQINLSSTEEGKETKVADLAWTRCTPGGCFADVKPDEAMLKSVRSVEAGVLKFQDSAGNLIGVPLSFNGLDQALTALDQQK